MKLLGRSGHGLLIGLWVCVLSCGEVRWHSPGPAPSCDPSKQSALTGSPRWAETFGKGGALACLRLLWGEGRATTVYVQLQSDGQLTAPDGQGSIEARLPREAKGQEIAFALFVFGSGLPSGPEQRAYCAKEMRATTYSCGLDAGKECWFSLRFSPRAEGFRAKPLGEGRSCQLQAPPPLAQEPAVTEPSEGPAREPQTLPEEPAAAHPEPPASEPEPQVAEPASEPPPEPGPEQPSPSLQLFARSAQGIGNDQGQSVAVDAQGNIYVAGDFRLTLSWGPSCAVSNAGGRDIFVAKFSTTGTCLWAAKAGGLSDDFAQDVAVDRRKGFVYVVGAYFQQASFGSIVKKGATPTFNGFVARLDPGTGSWLWVQDFDDHAGAQAHSVALNGAGDVFVAGHFSGRLSSSCPSQLSSRGSSDLFVAKFTAAGACGWASQGSSSGTLEAPAIESGPKHLWVAGSVRTKGASLQFGKAKTSLPQTDGFGVFLARIDATGKWQWVNHASSMQAMEVKALAVDDQGHGYITGFHLGTLRFPPKPLLLNQGNNGKDLFVARHNPSGTGWMWATERTGPLAMEGMGLALERTGQRLYVTGYLQGKTSYGSPLQILDAGSYKATFVATVGTGLGKWQWVQLAGDPGADDEGRALALDSRGQLYVTGLFFGTQAKFGAMALPSTLGQDVFLWKLKPGP